MRTAERVNEFKLEGDYNMIQRDAERTAELASV